MSAEQIQKDREMNQKELELNSLRAAVDAHKGMINEQLQNSLHLRTNLVLFQKELQRITNEKNASEATLKAQIQSLDQQLADATARIAELDTTLCEPQPTA